MEEGSNPSGAQLARMQMAATLLRMQIKEAKQICSAEGIPINGENVGVLANALATLYLAEVTRTA